MKIWVLLCVTLTASFAFASSINCDLIVNQVKIKSNTLLVLSEKKNKILENEEVRAFVYLNSSKKLVIEAFLFAEETRFYATGQAKSLSASLWNRDRQVEVACQVK